jgi:hypothetical protein
VWTRRSFKLNFKLNFQVYFAKLDLPRVPHLCGSLGVHHAYHACCVAPLSTHHPPAPTMQNLKSSKSKRASYNVSKGRKMGVFLARWYDSLTYLSLTFSFRLTFVGKNIVGLVDANPKGPVIKRSAKPRVRINSLALPPHHRRNLPQPQWRSLMVSTSR